MRAHQTRCLSLVLLLAVPSLGLAEDVRVTNFPAVQAVRGTVEVAGPVTVRGRTDTTRFVAFEDREVDPSRGGWRVRDFVHLGLIDATGHASLILSLAMRCHDGMKDGGVVGVLLVPEASYAREAMKRDEEIPLSLRLELPLQRGASPTLAASTGRLPLPLARWHAYLYQTGARPLRAHAFIMLGD